uniref:Uncharacterized protein n=1 Tax=Oryza meridionalis TaxID=40149 RepID=A0A0E0C0M5_9ORYZ
MNRVCCFVGTGQTGQWLPDRLVLSEFFDLCFIGCGGLTDISPAVRPAASRRSDRRRKGGQTGGGFRRRQLIRRLDRSSNLGQTGGFQAVRPA